MYSDGDEGPISLFKNKKITIKKIKQNKIEQNK